MNIEHIFTDQPVSMLWLMGGLIGLGLGMLIGEPSIIALSIAALITAIVAVSVSSLVVQVLLWGVLALSLAIVLRGLEPSEAKDLQLPPEAEVSELIPMGGFGQVHYQGSIWRAKCQISDVAIAVGQSVYVVGRQGNTLIVLPNIPPTEIPSQFPNNRQRS